ncbi:MAG: hypothetical protein KKB34_13515 [Bacteroidetes bacterium]|nr:hypothetical protein [Bacteroidota bacterium]
MGDNRYTNYCQTKYPCSRTEYGIMWVYIHGVPIPATYFVVREGRIWGCVGWCEREGCIVAPCDA